ncbi:MAG: hypothetical protein GF411_20385 [Candidatus Lokiarchaeota archaeon]|nr:hypothetical protein [Candidatus Lokiarchaeota archaeon]
MAKWKNVKVIYLDENEKRKSANGKAEDMGRYIKVDLNPSKRRIKFDTVLIPWDRVVKTIIFK